MKKAIKRVIKAINTVQLIETVFSLACVAYTVHTLIPKYETFPGVDPDKLIKNVNAKAESIINGGDNDGLQ